MVPDLLILALEYYRAPLRFPHLRDINRPLPGSVGNLVPAFGSALSPQRIAATADELGADREEIERAARFFLRQVLLAPGGDHYRVLGLSPTASDERIRQHYHLLVRVFHPDRSVDDVERDAVAAARINEAYRVLKSAAARRRYDRQLDFASEYAQARATDPISSSNRVDEPAFFGARVSEPKRSFGLGGGRKNWLLLWGVMGAVLVGFIAIVRFSEQPALLVNPELGDERLAKPSYLQTPLSSPGGRSIYRQREPSRSDSGAADRREESTGGLAATERAKRPKSASIDTSRTALSGQDIREAIPQELEPRSVAAEPLESVASAREVGAPPPGTGSINKLELSSDSATESASPLVAQGPKNKAPPPALPAEANQHTRQLSEHPVESANAGKNEKPLSAASTPERKAAPPPSTARAGQRAEEKSDPPKAGSKAEDRRKAVSRIVAQSTARVKATPSKVPKAPDKTKPREKKERAKRPEAAGRGGVRDTARSKAPATEKRQTRPQANPDSVIARIRHYYQTGDLRNFVSLFTANARITGGSGKAFIRSDYASLFARAPERRLSISGMRWRPGGQGRLTGAGSYRVSTRYRGSSNWRHASGTLQIELVPGNGGYKISKLFHR